MDARHPLGERDELTGGGAPGAGRPADAASPRAPPARLLAGDTLAARVRWTGTLATAAGPLPAGVRLEAHSSMWFTVRGGRIVRQENYDCLTAPSPS